LSGSYPHNKVEPTAVADGLRLFFDPGEVTELRALGVKRGPGKPHIEAGFYDHDHLQDMAAAALKLESIAKGVYFTLNPLKPAILSRRRNRVDYAEDQAGDKCPCSQNLIEIQALATLWVPLPTP
jgi:hypothetical protein